MRTAKTPACAAWAVLAAALACATPALAQLDPASLRPGHTPGEYTREEADLCAGLTAVRLDVIARRKPTPERAQLLKVARAMVTLWNAVGGIAYGISRQDYAATIQPANKAVVLGHYDAAARFGDLCVDRLRAHVAEATH